MADHLLLSHHSHPPLPLSPHAIREETSSLRVINTVKAKAECFSIMKPPTIEQAASHSCRSHFICLSSECHSPTVYHVSHPRLQIKSTFTIPSPSLTLPPLCCFLPYKYFYSLSHHNGQDSLAIDTPSPFCSISF